MAAQVLYRKWRPQTFEQVVGQKHVVQTLRNALRSDEVAHAYLFAGPRGTGKTTVARLLAKAVNCLGQDEEKPCNQCPICQAINNGQLLDLIEIDAASNRGIDEIRDLRTKVNFAPSQARYKVYILDEAHMLTNEAFNALLKTLEEPPSHAIFILVTTEPHKLPATIISRCQRFDFHRLSPPEIIGELERISELEGVRVQPRALELIARSATGSLRDAISLLDQVITAGGQEVTLEQVQEALGMARMGAAAELVSSLIEGDVSLGLRLINQVIDEGADPRQFAAQVVEYLHGLMLLKVGGLEPPISAELMTRMQEQAARLSTPQLLQMLRLFNRAGQEMRRGTQLQLPLEMALVEAALNAQELQTPAQPAAGSAKVRARAVRKAGSEEVTEVQSPSPASSQATEEVTKRDIGLAQVRAAWPQILQRVRSRSVAAAALLKACEPVDMEEGRIVLRFRYSFHRDKVEEQANKSLVEEVVSSVLGEFYPIHCVLGGPSPTDAPPSASGEEPRPEDQDKLAAVANDPVVQAMMDRYGARVVDVQQQ